MIQREVHCPLPLWLVWNVSRNMLMQTVSSGNLIHTLAQCVDRCRTVDLLADPFCSYVICRLAPEDNSQTFQLYIAFHGIVCVLPVVLIYTIFGIRSPEMTAATPSFIYFALLICSCAWSCPEQVWGRSTKHDPMRCGLAHQLQDEDVLQIVPKTITQQVC